MASALSYFSRRGLPIVAQATALGGPVAILRISGTDLRFLEKNIGPLPPPGTFSYRSFFSDPAKEKKIDQVLALYFKAPKSFTGEDVVELQSHGVPALIEEIEAALIKEGAQRALPGEFSFRALANQKLTLAQAEALNQALGFEGIRAQHAAELLGVVPQQQEKLNQILEHAIKKLEQARGRVEAAVDFPEAEVEQKEEVASALHTIEDLQYELNRLEKQYADFNMNAAEMRVVLAGAANAGKSTLMNILAESERSIVSSEEGTTRDFVETKIKLNDGSWVRIVDTAGLRTQVGDDIERQGILKSQQQSSQAHLVLWVEDLRKKDLARNPAKELLPQAGFENTTRIFTHCDLIEGAPKNCRLEGAFYFNLLDAKSHALQRKLLSEHIALHVREGLKTIHSECTANSFEYFVSRRQKRLMDLCQLHIAQAKLCLEEASPIELAGEELRAAEEKLKEALGRELKGEYIEAIFAQFCLGK